jgi:hypothetical protein
VRLYLATRYTQRDLMKAYRAKLHELGHEVTSRWLDFEDENPEQFVAEGHDRDTASSHAAPGPVREMVARTDIADVLRADAIMLFTDHVGRRGGMFCEWGAMLAKLYLAKQFAIPEHDQYLHWTDPVTDKMVFLTEPVLLCIGSEINVFQHYPETLVYQNFDDAISDIGHWGERWQTMGIATFEVKAGKPVATNGLRGKAIEDLRPGAICEIDVISGRVRNAIPNMAV